MNRQTNILEYLDDIILTFSKKTCYANESEEFSFQYVYENSRSIGTFLAQNGHPKTPVVVFMKKHPKMIVAFFGVVYSGSYYIPIDEEMPAYRIEMIFKDLMPQTVICDDSTAGLISNFNYSGQVYTYDEMTQTAPDDDILKQIRSESIDTDPVYIVFTSGSTGVPKGVVACHRSLIDYIETLSEVLDISNETVFGNQTPFYVDACLKDIYPTIKYGATVYIIPRQFFLFPLQLIEFLNKFKINTICWVASALTLTSGLGAFDKTIPKYLHTVASCSEVFPMKQFILWQKNLPHARFFNLYGPTEATGVSCYYEVDRILSLEDVLPIGRPFRNTEILLLNEQNKLSGSGEPGEICIRGTALSLGYYNAFDKTNEVFVQNPLNNSYSELIYRTGDIGKYNERGDLVFLSRKDYQIKHMGHRIELGEIEMIFNNMPGMLMASCIFDDDNKKIILYYVGSISKTEIIEYGRQKLPRFMLPNLIEQLEIMPLTINGKINRKWLKESYNNQKRS